MADFVFPRYEIFLNYMKCMDATIDSDDEDSQRTMIMRGDLDDEDPQPEVPPTQQTLSWMSLAGSSQDKKKENQSKERVTTELQYMDRRTDQQDYQPPMVRP